MKPKGGETLSVVVNAELLSLCEVGNYIKTPKRHYKNLSWWVHVYPNGDSRANKGYVGVSIFTSVGGFDVEYCLTVDGTYVKVDEKYSSKKEPVKREVPRFATHEELRLAHVVEDGEFTIRCKTKFVRTTSQTAKEPENIIEDSCIIELNQNGLGTVKLYQTVLTDKQTMDDTTWYHDVFPCGYREDDDGEPKTLEISYALSEEEGIDSIGVYIHVVGGNVKVSGEFLAKDHYDMKSDYVETFEFDFNDDDQHGIEDFFHCRYKLDAEVTCNATFTWSPPITLAPVKVHEFIDPSNPDSCDAVIKVGKKDIKVSRGFLMMVSPVFKAMFGLGTKEIKTGVIKIADFSYETVKNALDYGHNVEQKTTSEINDMICFYEKFNIQAPIKTLQTWLKEKAAAKTAKRTRKSSFDTDESGSESYVETDESDGEATIETDEPAEESTVSPAKRAKM